MSNNRRPYNLAGMNPEQAIDLIERLSRETVRPKKMPPLRENAARVLEEGQRVIDEDGFLNLNKIAQRLNLTRNQVGGLMIRLRQRGHFQQRYRGQKQKREPLREVSKSDALVERNRGSAIVWSNLLSRGLPHEQRPVMERHALDTLHRAAQLWDGVRPFDKYARTAIIRNLRRKRKYWFRENADFAHNVPLDLAPQITVKEGNPNTWREAHEVIERILHIHRQTHQAEHLPPGDRLSEPLALGFLLRNYGGLPYAQIGQILGLSKQTAHKKVKIAEALVRAHFRDSA